MKNFVSLDIFDTIVTRNVYRPEDLFLRVRKRLYESSHMIIPVQFEQEFKESRILAEREARLALKNRQEVTLEEIIALLTQQMALTTEAGSLIAAYEIEEEIRSVVPVQQVLALIRQMRLEGKQIIYLSDMYLPDAVIRNMLMRVGILEKEDRLYVSSAIGKKKSTGSLYRHVLNDIGAEPKQITHIGDYLWSDYLVPRWKYGIRSQIVRHARCNVYERLWGEQCSCLFCSSVSGAMRASRVAKLGEGTQTEQALYDIGCDVVGPIMLSFVSWVLQQAARNGIRRLYFLSRDGEIMLEIARQLSSRTGSAVDLRYLHVSRTAVFPAMAGVTVDKHTMAWIKEDNIVLTLRILADRLKVNMTDLQMTLARSDVLLLGPDLPLSRRSIGEIYRVLVSHPSVRDIVTDSGRSALENLSGYLEQEGMFDGTPCALVDLGWHGSIQDVICTCVIDKLGKNGITGYYFGVDQPSRGACRKFGYMFDFSDPSARVRYSHLLRILMELLCSGRQGMVIGYNFEPRTGYTPVISEIEHPANKDSVTHIRRGVVSFMQNLDVASLAAVDYEHVKSPILDILSKLFFYPAPEEASALGNMRFSADQAGHGVHQVAAPFTINTAASYLAKRSYAERSTLSSWFFASWIRSRWGVRAFLYPLVLLLRLYYVGVKMLMFNKMRLIDGLNKAISDRKGPFQ